MISCYLQSRSSESAGDYIFFFNPEKKERKKKEDNEGQPRPGSQAHIKADVKQIYSGILLCFYVRPRQGGPHPSLRELK